MITIEEKRHGDGVDFEAMGAHYPKKRIRAGVERGRIWANELHGANIDEAQALANCIQRAINEARH